MNRCVQVVGGLLIVQHLSPCLKGVSAGFIAWSLDQRSRGIQTKFKQTKESHENNSTLNRSCIILASYRVRRLLGVLGKKMQSSLRGQSFHAVAVFLFKTNKPMYPYIVSQPLTAL